MKKSLLALAVLGAYAGTAMAQSSVTLYGTVDLAGTYIKNDGSKRRFSLSQDGINSSQLGFRGVEDLGGGLRAGFNLLAGVNADTGTSNAKFWNRRSTVSLFSGLGELRLGRDYTPSFWNMTIFDAFGTNGIGSSTNPRQLYNGTRMDNTIGYFLPSNLGGFYGQVMAAAAEGGTSGDRPARYLGGRFGFAAGPFDIAAAYSQERFRVGSNVTSGQAGGQLVPIAAGDNQKTYNVGGAFDFGFGKLLGYYNYDKVPNANEKFFSVSANFPFGQNEFRVGYDLSKLHRNGALLDSDVDQIKATYQYNLSKRTAMYGTASFMRNKDATRLTLGAVGSSATALPTSSDDSKGFQLGVRHFF
jgi:predicted porin